MKAVSAKLDNTTILIEAVGEGVEVLGKPVVGRQTKTTGIDNRALDAYNDAKLAITAIAKDIGTQFDALADKARPTRVELEFSMGFSASTGVWVITAKGESALKVKLTWGS